MKLNLKKNLTIKQIESFLFKKGKFYVSHELPKDIKYRELHKCFDNALITSVKSGGKYKYVEGLAINILTGEWLMHAWLTDGIEAKCFDNTWRIQDNKGNVFPMQTIYLGIEMEQDDLVKFRLDTEYQGVFANAWRSPKLADKLINK